MHLILDDKTGNLRLGFYATRSATGSDSLEQVGSYGQVVEYREVDLSEHIKALVRDVLAEFFPDPADLKDSDCDFSTQPFPDG